jgi:hypothetical protein
MARRTIFLIACILAAAAPFWSGDETPAAESAPQNFRGFPSRFEGAEIKPLPLSENEAIFLADFPGKVGRFSDGRREIILRFITQATRKLHSAQDCLAAIGYKTKPLPLKIDGIGNRWGCFTATKNGKSLRVCERIYSEKTAENWTDVSAWYWSALAQKDGEWWAIMVAETMN